MIKSKKEKYLTNKSKGIVSPTIEELTRSTDIECLETNNKTLADNVFKGLRDDLDVLDEDDVGKKEKQHNLCA